MFCTKRCRANMSTRFKWRTQCKDSFRSSIKLTWATAREFSHSTLHQVLGKCLHLCACKLQVMLAITPNNRVARKESARIHDDMLVKVNEFLRKIIFSDEALIRVPCKKNKNNTACMIRTHLSNSGTHQRAQKLMRGDVCCMINRPVPLSVLNKMWYPSITRMG